MDTCWERAGLLALVNDVYCICVTFLCGILGHVWYLIVSFPDLCLLSYFDYSVPDADEIKRMQRLNCKCSQPLLVQTCHSNKAKSFIQGTENFPLVMILWNTYTSLTCDHTNSLMH